MSNFENQQVLPSGWDGTTYRNSKIRSYNDVKQRVLAKLGVGAETYINNLMQSKTRYNSKEREGIFTFSKFVSKELKGVIREQATSDVGVDCIIECVDEHENPNGLLIGVQVKAGLGNVHETNKYFTRYVKEAHYYYWLKIKIPMIMVLYDDSSELLYWEKINYKNLKKTSKKLHFLDIHLYYFSY